MKLNILFLNKTTFFIAIEKENLDIIELLLSQHDIDINRKSILNQIYFFLYHFKSNVF